MALDINLTHRVLLILKHFLEAGTKEYAGADIFRKTRIPSGNLYVILGNLQEAGVLESRWEDIDPKAAGRPKRRFFKLTKDGRSFAKQRLDELALVPPRRARR
jgi:PadR family transcriptional regulator, regulatory protein PadR